MNNRNFFRNDDMDDASITVEVDMMRMGILVRFEVDVSYYLMNFTNEVVITNINEMWAAGVFDHGYDGADYKADKPRSINVKVDPEELTEDEVAEIKANVVADIKAQMRRDRY
jgi:hypothetical protein